MDRVLVTLLAAALLVGVVPAAASVTDTDDGSQPGATFAGVVGVQRAEVGNEVAQRSLDQRLDRANSNASKAAVVAEETNRLEARLEELEAEKERLEAARQNGSISRGEYQARLASLAAETRALERRANQTAAAASGLSDEALSEKGVDAAEVRSVAQRASEVGGGAVSEAATRVAGKGVGNGLSDAPAGVADGSDTDAEPGPPDDRGQDERGTDCRPSQNCTTDENPVSSPGNDVDNPGNDVDNPGNDVDNPGNEGEGRENANRTGNGTDRGNNTDRGNGSDGNQGNDGNQGEGNDGNQGGEASEGSESDDTVTTTDGNVTEETATSGA